MRIKLKEVTIMLKGFKKGFGFGIGWLVGQSLFLMSLDKIIEALKPSEKEETKEEEPETTEE